VELTVVAASSTLGNLASKRRFGRIVLSATTTAVLAVLCGVVALAA
jgi:hypothetical protein